MARPKRCTQLKTDESASKKQQLEGMGKEAPRAYLCEGRQNTCLSYYHSLLFYTSFPFRACCLGANIENRQPAPKTDLYFLQKFFLRISFFRGKENKCHFHLKDIRRQVCDFLLPPCPAENAPKSGRWTLFIYWTFLNSNLVIFLGGLVFFQGWSRPAGCNTTKRMDI